MLYISEYFRRLLHISWSISVYWVLLYIGHMIPGDFRHIKQMCVYRYTVIHDSEMKNNRKIMFCKLWSLHEFQMDCFHMHHLLTFTLLINRTYVTLCSFHQCILSRGQVTLVYNFQRNYCTRLFFPCLV